MYECCACCEGRTHTIGHADLCPRHQRAEAAERAKAKRAKPAAKTPETES